MGASGTRSFKAFPVCSVMHGSISCEHVAETRVPPFSNEMQTDRVVTVGSFFEAIDQPLEPDRGRDGANRIVGIGLPGGRRFAPLRGQDTGRGARQHGPASRHPACIAFSSAGYLARGRYWYRIRWLARRSRSSR